MDGPPPDPGPGAQVGWTVEQRTLDSGRTYFVGAPTCVGSTGCAAWLDHPRKLIIWLHGAGQVEDAANATPVVKGIFAFTGGDAIPVFAVSAGATRVFDADLCCTFAPVDEIGYLQDVIADVGTVAPIDPSHVGLSGASNGGMLATKAICTRPDLFKAIAVWAASWQGQCDKAPVTIGHWHGSADVSIPVAGGTTSLRGHSVRFPPADALRGHLAAGSTFKLTVVPGAPHWPAPLASAEEMLVWLDRHL